MLLPTGALYQLQLSRFHHRPRRGHPRPGGRPSPPRRDREHHPRPQVRRGAQPSSLGTLSRQRRLAGGTGHRPQSGPLDWAHRSVRGGGYHQDPAATLLLPGGTAHPLGPAPHSASTPRLALAKPVQLRPRQTTHLATTLLIAPTASDPSARLSTGLTVPRQAGPRVAPAAICPLISPFVETAGRQKSPSRGCHTQRLSQSVGINALPDLPFTFHLSSDQPHRIPSVDLG